MVIHTNKNSVSSKINNLRNWHDPCNHVWHRRRMIRPPDQSREFVKMTVRFEALQRSTVAFLGAMIATVMLVIASAPHIPLA